MLQPSRPRSAGGGWRVPASLHVQRLLDRDHRWDGTIRPHVGCVVRCPAAEERRAAPWPTTWIHRHRRTCEASTPSSGWGRPATGGARARPPGTWPPGPSTTRSTTPASSPPTSTACSSYSGNDSTFSTFVAGDLGIRLNFYMDVFGGGSSTEALIGIAIGVIEAGMCKTVAIFRSMNGYTQVRIGGTGRPRGGAHQRRRAAHAALRLAERRADVRPDVHAPHVRLRHHAGAGGGA